jgi:hypothetical protein
MVQKSLMKLMRATPNHCLEVARPLPIRHEWLLDYPRTTHKYYFFYFHYFFIIIIFGWIEKGLSWVENI